MSRHIGGSLLPSNEARILQSVATPFGTLQVRIIAELDTHGLFHQWTAVSPSIYTLDGYPVWLAFNGDKWYLAFNGDYDGARPWPSRDCAAAAIAQAFLEHELFGKEAL